MMKIALSAATVALAVGWINVANADHFGEVPDHKVAICHFPGHEGDRPITGPHGLVCEEQGGKVLVVAKQGAERGHGVDVPDDN